MPTGFDEIVVGAGSAGTVLAARLVARGARVLLVEAGPDYPDQSALPADLANGLTPSMVRHDWGLTAVRDDGVELPVPRGKVVGGCSAVNTCLAVRPLVGDFDTWGPDWSWDEVAPFFERVEADGDFPASGPGGPLWIRRPGRETFSPLSAALVDGAVASGFPTAPNLNAPGATGVGPLPLNLTPDGRRRSVTSAYLDPVRHLPGLTLLADTVVDRVLFDGTRAVGVSLVARGKRWEARANRVTLCAGAYVTPAVLHRSGVGPAELVRSLNIEVVADLPGVGAGLSDHSQVAIGALPQPGVCDPEDPCAQVVLRYTADGSSMVDDMQLYALNHVELDVYAPHMVGRAPDGRAFMMTSNLMGPRGRGRVSARSADPTDLPLIELDHTRDPEDLRRQCVGVRLCWDFLNQPDFAALTEEILDVDAATVESDRDVAAFVRRSAQTAHHPAGTARLGPASDPGAVVDSRCRVRGTEGLRVADASVIPEPVRANTNLVSMMIGERVASWQD